MPKLDKVKLPIASESMSKLDLSCDHITTGNWMMPQPVYYRHMIPRQKLNNRAIVTCRVAPMAVPTYGRMRVNLRAFFVPFRVVFPRFNEFISDTIGTNYDNAGLVDSSPVIGSDVILDLFVNPDQNDYRTWTTSRVSSSDAWDFESGGNYYIFTSLGRHYYKVLTSLGYRLCPSDKNASVWSALPLLCYAKVYLDWYANSSYMDSAGYLAVQKLFDFNNPLDNLRVNRNALISILFFTRYAIYDGDYFTSAWDSPVAPNQGLYSQLSGNDVTTGSYSVNMIGNGTPVMNASNSGLGSTYVHQLLKSMTDFVKRNQLSGARVIDRTLARYGVNLDSAKSNRSIYLGVSSQDLDVRDVTSMADTSASGDPSNLGDFGGRGFGQGAADFEFTADEFGMMIIVSTIHPSGGYYQGIDRNNMHLNKTDFFIPEFDNLGVQAISKGEVFVANESSFGTMSDYNAVFGYTPRYAEYKIPKSWCTGDMVLPSVMTGGDSWSLFREFSVNDFVGGISDLVHSLRFTSGEFDSLKFNRIFNNTRNDADKFYLCFHFDVGSYAPMKDLFETYDFDSDGKEITLDSQGTKMN